MSRPRTSGAGEEPAGGYEIVRFPGAAVEELASLSALLWRCPLPLAASYLRWKYLENPFLDEPPVYVARHRGEIVAMRGMMGAMLEAGSPTETIPFLCPTDLAIHPEHRDRGLFSRIMSVAMDDAARSGFRWVFNLSASPVTRMGSLAQGWRSTPAIETMWRRGGRLRVATRRLLRRMPTFPNKLPALTQLTAPPPFRHLDRARSKGGVSVTDRPRPEAMADLVRRLGHDGRIRHVRDERFFAWRFGNPMSLYRFLFVENGSGALDGYVVLQSRPWVRNVGTSIVDLEAVDPESLERLLSAAFRSGKFTVVDTWTSSLSEARRETLRRHGFVDSTGKDTGSQIRTALMRPTRVVTDEWTLAGRPLLDLASWDLRLIYSDGP